MNVELSKFDLIHLVKGTEPDYSLFDYCDKLGYYKDSTGWKWYDSKLNELTEEQLLDLYKKCQQSWKR